MPYFTKYHLREQPAYALLGPMRATLLELERRAQHYVDRVNLEAGASEQVRAAHDAIARAREEVERLWQSSAESSGQESGR
jgi:hypothetical protein